VKHDATLPVGGARQAMERDVGDPGGRGVQPGRVMASGTAVVSQSAVVNVAPCDDGRGARDLRAGGFDGSVLAPGRVTVVCHPSLRLGVTIPHQGRSGPLPHEHRSPRGRRYGSDRMQASGMIAAFAVPWCDVQPHAT